MADDTHSRFATSQKTIYNFKPVAGHTTKHMKHGRSCDIDIWWTLGCKCCTRAAPSCDIFSLGFIIFQRPLAAVHHLYIVVQTCKKSFSTNWLRCADLIDCEVFDVYRLVALVSHSCYAVSRIVYSDRRGSSCAKRTVLLSRLTFREVIQQLRQTL